MQKSSLLRGMALALASAAAASKNLIGGVIEESPIKLPKRVRSARHPEARTYGWLDRAGMPHGASGDKLRRKAMQGQVGLTAPGGWLHSWSSTKVASMGMGKRRRPETPNITMAKPINRRQWLKESKAARRFLKAQRRAAEEAAQGASPAT